ncbi:hypothetical protein JHK82_044680 [Glycine max]|nr:hypothetical protein JHK82_044680 [Glycine max]
MKHQGKALTINDTSQKIPGTDVPGSDSEVSEEITATLVASSIVYRKYHIGYSTRLLQRDIKLCHESDKQRVTRKVKWFDDQKGVGRIYDVSTGKSF